MIRVLASICPLTEITMPMIFLLIQLFLLLVVIPLIFKIFNAYKPILKTTDAILMFLDQRVLLKP